jgi:uncharacterized repeat protein (TIGR03803 family)
MHSPPSRTRFAAPAVAAFCTALFLAAPPSASAATTEMVLYAFTGGNDGAIPYAGLIADSAGNLYGTTRNGGAYAGGTVFKLAPPAAGTTTWTETVLHSFAGSPSDGAYPYAGLIADSAGNLYGTTTVGGASNLGVVFKLAPDGTETVLA